MRTNGHAIVALVAALVGACQHTKEDPWAGKLYIGDSDQAAAVRAQVGDVIACSSKRFDGMVCMSDDDFEHFAERFHYATEQCLEASLGPVNVRPPEVDQVDAEPTPAEADEQ